MDDILNKETWITKECKFSAFLTLNVVQWGLSCISWVDSLVPVVCRTRLIRGIFQHPIFLVPIT